LDTPYSKQLYAKLIDTDVEKASLMSAVDDDPNRPQAVRDFLSQKPKVDRLGRALSKELSKSESRQLRGITMRNKASVYLD